MSDPCEAQGSGPKKKKKEPVYYCMVPPPLTKLLKGILAEYPDGGQILKELIQNADDAGANEIKFLLDKRIINRDVTGETHVFTKFFQAPALCVYNDAEFTEEDWRGIFMVYSSVKENDRLKVGRFGLGFKSVFHITDHPCIISGDRIILMDPQQDANKVNAIVRIKELDEIEGIDPFDFFKAFDNKFGVDKISFIKSGHFKGTLFWFPLREKESELSDNLYDPEKVMQLFKSVQSEASSILLFLKHLTSIRLEITSPTTQNELFADVSIENATQVKNERDKLLSEFKQMGNLEKDLTSTYQMKIETNIASTNCIQVSEWLVVNCIIGDSASNEFKRLIQSKQIGLSPFVGMAIPLHQATRIDGHVFCFLPLPKEGSKLTGLPFHVNGHFALSQNRHHIKWATDDQNHKYVNDDILWNEKMLKEALKLAFNLLYEKAIEMSVSRLNTPGSVKSVYDIIPDIQSVNDTNWRMFVDTAVGSRMNKSLVFCLYSGKWIQLSEATFTSFNALPTAYEHLKHVLRQVIGDIGLSPVDAPEGVLNTLRTIFPNHVVDISTTKMIERLHNSKNYINLDDHKKLALLAYLTSDRRDIKQLDGLKLLKLASGEWTQFDRTKLLYIVTEEELKMFPGLESRFVDPTMKADSSTAKTLDWIFDQHYFGVTILNDEDMKTMLIEIQKTHLGSTRIIDTNSTLSTQWLISVWNAIRGRDIRHFVDQPLFPILLSGTFQSVGKIHLVELQKPLLLKAYVEEVTLSSDMECCLKLLGITVIPELPTWIPLEIVKEFIYIPSQQCVFSLLEKHSKCIDQNQIEIFNAGVTESNIRSLIEFLSQCQSYSRSTQQVLSRLKMFELIETTATSTQRVNLQNVKHFIRVHEKEFYPPKVKFLSKFVVVRDEEKLVVEKLGLKKLSAADFMEMKLQHLSDESEQLHIMLFFLQHIWKFENLIDTVRKIPFIINDANDAVCIDEVFDPFDPLLHRLFTDENNRFPKQFNQWKVYRSQLLQLGMKRVSDITSDDIYEVAKNIDKNKSNGKVDKAKALQRFLEDMPEFLEQPCRSGEKLGKLIGKLYCFVFLSRETDAIINQKYPHNLKWFSNSCVVCPPNQMKSMTYWQIVSSSMPLAYSQSEKLCSYYYWNEQPFSEYVLRHLINIKQCRITVDEKIKFAPMIESVYLSLKQFFTNSVKESIVSDALVWTGETFVAPSDAVVKTNLHDLQLYPYFHCLAGHPLILESFFEKLGCYGCQDEYVLVEFLKRIKDKYMKTSHTRIDTELDLNMSLQVLERLADKCIDKEWMNEKVIVVIKSENESTLEFAPLSKCVYDDDDDDDLVDAEANEDDPDTKHVHSSITYTLAKKLGISSLTDQTRKAAENVEEWGQQEKFTRRLKTLLDEGYTDGISVAKELLQNADDAGATEVCFVYDKRKTLGNRLLSTHLADFQGEALLCYNNQVFSDEDLTNITHFNASFKRDVSSSIGKFGLGFTSVYNLTDLPSFISGKYMVMFDPHEKYLEDDLNIKSPRGKKIPLSKRALVRRHADQFLPFEGLFSCNVIKDPFQPFPGTLFRFPLRTAKQANESEISKKMYRHEDVISLLELLIRNADMLLLFTQKVSTIKLFYIAENADSLGELKEIFSIHKDVSKCVKELDSKETSSILQQAAFERQATHAQDLIEMHNVRIKQKLRKNKILSSEIVLPSLDATWLITWLMDRDHIECDIVSPPLVSIATPCVGQDDLTPQDFKAVHAGTYRTGHLFCFLPLPIETGLAFHINGCFHVSSDRRMLTLMTEDDRSDGQISKLYTWNKILLQSSLVKALLKHISSTTSSVSAQGNTYLLWPQSASESVEPLVTNFYRQIIDLNPKIFYGNGNFCPFKEIAMVDPDVLGNQDIGSIALEFVTNVPINNKTYAVTLPDFVAQNIRRFNTDRKDVIEDAFVKIPQLLIHFLNNSDNKYWGKNHVAYCRFLRCAILSEDNTVLRCLQNTNCIKTEPYGKLRMIKELVHPSSKLSKLFTDSDERFISNHEILRDQNILSKLVELGMISKSLSPEFLIDRCTSIATSSQQCKQCARNRLKHLLKYLSECKVGLDVLQKLMTIQFLPVLAKPDDWPTTWYTSCEINDIVCCPDQTCSEHARADSVTLKLGKPNALFRQDCYPCVGTLYHILDETNYASFKTNVLKKIGIRDQSDITLDMLMGQLDNVANACSNKMNADITNIKEVLDSIFTELDKLTINMLPDDFPCKIERFCTVLSKPMIYVGSDGSEIVPIRKVAIKMKKTCAPDLFKLPTGTSPANLRVFQKLGLRNQFCVSDIIDVLKVKVGKIFENNRLSIKNIIDLLINLAWCMTRECKTYEDLKDFKEYIIAPDTEGKLWPTYQLALDDHAIKSKTKLRLLHEGISPKVAKAIGVKSKRLQLIKQKTRIIPFGQREKLTTRLNGLLKDYPCDDSIMKELIQNADDAGAREIQFIKYYETKFINRSIETGGLLQPALCVFNDTFFSETDLEGIQNLGIGGKTHDSLKTGQFGVGFNAVYHITDTPSFLTKGPNLGERGTVCMFDPLLQSIGELSDGEPGIHCDVKDLLDDFPDSTLGYPPFEGNNGTMFRLPLRTKSSEISEQCMSPEQVDAILQICISAMPGCLHFVKHLQKIKVLNYENGKYTEIYRVEAKLSEKDAKLRDEFFRTVKNISSTNSDEKINNLRVKPFDVAYKMTINDSVGECSKWLVIKQFGSDNDMLVNKVIPHFKSGDLGLLPMGGISLRLLYGDVNSFLYELSKDCPSKESREKTKVEIWKPLDGKPYCFLPLPGTTGLPFHLNGNFAVDRGRRGLWRDVHGYRKDWNDFLLNSLIVETLHKALILLQNYWVNDHIERLQNADIRRTCLKIYFSYFPSQGKTTDTYWDSLVTTLFDTMLSKLWKVFPYVVEEDTLSSGQLRLIVRWINLATNEISINGALVNSLMTRCVVADAINIENVLKQLNIVVTETPIDIIDAMSKHGQTSMVYTKPRVVMQIIREKRIVIGRPLSKTVLKNIRIVNSLLKYMSTYKHFDDRLQGMPLCVTNDMTVNVFGSERIFCSEYCDLLPCSSKQFMHKDLVSFFKGRQKLFQLNILKPFTIQDLHEQLPCSYNPSTFQVGSDIEWRDSQCPIKPEFILRFFCFLHENTKKHMYGYCDYAQFAQNVRMFSEWSFLPSKEVNAERPIYRLVPVKNAQFLLLKPTREDISPVFSNLQIPGLDDDLFLKHNQVYLCMTQLIASENKPDILLKCVHENKKRLNTSQISKEEVVKLLQYFMQSKKTIHESLGPDNAIRLLKSLPLHENIDGNLMSLTDHVEVIIVPNSMPHDGLREWANNSGISLLKENPYLSELYNFLSAVKYCDLFSIYKDKLIPGICNLPIEHWLTHVEFIKTTVLISVSDDVKKNSLISQMKQMRFIEVHGQYYCAKELYDGSHPVFERFQGVAKDCIFLPEKFMTKEWKPFMIALGLLRKPSEKMVLAFAETLETQGSAGLTETLKEASNELVQYLFSATLSPLTIEKIKAIKFLVPYQVPDDLQRLYPAFCHNGQLICFEGACSAEFTDVCWTSVPLIKIPDKGIQLTRLNMKLKPLIGDVVKHAKNICRILHDDCKREQISFPQKQNYMTPLYEFLSKESSDMFTDLKNTPFIIISDKVIVEPPMVFISSSASDEIAPYLYKAPKELYRYSDVFEKIGSKQEVCCSQYASVLAAIHAEYTDNVIHPNTLELVSKAIEKLFAILTLNRKDKRNTIDSVPVLYLPNRNKVLCRANDLTVDDNKFYCEFICKTMTINIFLGFKELGIEINDSRVAFQQLPNQLQPRILSEDVSETVPVESICELQNKDKNAARFESFLQSYELLEALCRLFHHQTPALWTSEDDARLSKKLSEVRIKEVTGLKTVISFRNTRVGCIHRDYFVCSPSNKTDNDASGLTDIESCLYYQKSTCNTTTESLCDAVMELLEQVTENKLSKNSSLMLQKILDFVDKPDEISKYLDQKKIQAYECSNVLALSAFPSLGTYVHKQFYPFMIQAISPFQQHEYRYVALELEKNDEEDESKYIYVHIVELVDTGDASMYIKYHVNVGPRQEMIVKVPIYRLYKFVPQNSNTNIGAYINAPNTEIPFEENCGRLSTMLEQIFRLDEKERLLILRRNLLEWNPCRFDESRKQYSSKIFDFLQSSILSLGEGRPHQTRTNKRRVSFRRTSSYRNLLSNVTNTAQNYASEFRQNFSVYRESRRSGTFVHTISEKCEVRSPGEYKRWLRQAKKDFITGQSIVKCEGNHAETFNWICYISHQACEKAIKAAWFLKDANSLNRQLRSHSLVGLAIGLENDNITVEARSLEFRLNIHNNGSFRLRYPDCVDGSNIPSDVFSKEDAEFALETAKKILDLVDALSP